MDENNGAFTPPKERFVYRLKFTKGRGVQFIGHLDLMRLFQRAIKRANLPVVYSKGFNPHQILSFASPLTLGATSCGEYGDVEMSRPVDCMQIIAALNAQMPEGLQVLHAVLLKQKAQKAMADIAAAAYEVTIDALSPREMQQAVQILLAREQIVVSKKTKKKEKEVDIKPEILNISVGTGQKSNTACLLLCAGSVKNLKPQPVMQALCEAVGKEFAPYGMAVCRLDLFREENGTLLPLDRGDIC